ncbi:MAG: anion permease [Halobacteria archaeon]|nr:anion permease [Halobacteria archaeon]
MLAPLLIVGLGMAVFVGFNIGGSSTGVAFGPSVGSRVVGKVGAALLMSVFALLGGWFVGKNVIETMGGEIVPSTYFTLATSVGILFFVGLALLISNLFGVPASTSMTAVGAIAGLGVATNSTQWDVLGRIVTWWLIAPVIAFWLCIVIGRYFYPYLEAWMRLERNTQPLVSLDRSGVIPVPRLAPDASRRQLTGSFLVVGIGCYMAFSAGASNVANAVAPLVGSGNLSVNNGVFLAAAAISLGAFTIARRTLDTVGNDLTDLPLPAALVVETVSATVITLLSLGGIPASLAVTATSCVIGLGWGRATRRSTVLEAATRGMETEETASTATGPLSSMPTVEAEDPDEVPPIGEEDTQEIPETELFNAATTGRVITLWILTPTLSALGSFALFTAVETFF